MAEDTPMNIAQKICDLCNNRNSKYCCPRCNTLYCSLDCYKSEKHSECSEGFYRDCVSEELASYQADDESKQKMIDILKKMQAEGGDTNGLLDDIGDVNDEIENIDSDDEEEIELHERIKDLNLNDADAIWNALTEDERNEFEAILNQGDVGSIMPQWEPWWMYRKEKKLVEDVNEKDVEGQRLKLCPVLKKVPEITSLTTVQPSKTIRYNITNVLASYTFVMRYFNGEIDATEWAIYFLNICANLDANTNFEELTIASGLIETDKESLDVMKHDTILIIQGPSEANKNYYCKAALSQLHRIFTEAKTAGKSHKTDSNSKGDSAKDKNVFSKKFPEHEIKNLSTLDVSKVKKCIKKLEYYLSYVESCSMDFEG
ncbi:HIT zinc finger family protein [Operophtera brumata]|uniref:HIT zinc finger family protein n=1 Tax=Operophtera brumata TaxID=104452 RepID=A0A0L7LVH5_OPEBR|nr:HIT zinc finger family protein [Operophtera brumata]